MGLLYLFPTNKNESDYVILQQDSNSPLVTIKSYGLAWIFWVYAAAALFLVGILFLSVYNPLLKLLSMATLIDKILIFSFIATLILVIITIISLLYWQIHLVVSQDAISIEYRPFGIKIFSKKILRDDALTLKVIHFLETPNVARIEQDDRYREFQNKGYFELIAVNNSQQLLIDRSSRKADLEDLLKLLSLK